MTQTTEIPQTNLNPEQPGTVVAIPETSAPEHPHNRSLAEVVADPRVADTAMKLGVMVMSVARGAAAWVHKGGALARPQPHELVPVGKHARLDPRTVVDELSEARAYIPKHGSPKVAKTRAKQAADSSLGDIIAIGHLADAHDQETHRLVSGFVNAAKQEQQVLEGRIVDKGMAPPVPFKQRAKARTVQIAGGTKAAVRYASTQLAGGTAAAAKHAGTRLQAAPHAIGEEITLTAAELRALASGHVGRGVQAYTQARQEREQRVSTENLRRIHDEDLENARPIQRGGTSLPTDVLVVPKQIYREGRREYIDKDGVTRVDDAKFLPTDVMGNPIEEGLYLRGLTEAERNQVLEAMWETPEEVAESVARGYALADGDEQLYVRRLTLKEHYERAKQAIVNPGATLEAKLFEREQRRNLGKRYGEDYVSLTEEGKEERRAFVDYLRSQEELSFQQLEQLRSTSGLTVKERLRRAQLQTKVAICVGTEAVRGMVPLSDAQETMIKNAETRLMERIHGRGYMGLSAEDQARQDARIEYYKETGRFDALEELVGHKVPIERARYKAREVIRRVRPVGRAALESGERSDQVERPETGQLRGTELVEPDRVLELTR